MPTPHNRCAPDSETPGPSRNEIHRPIIYVEASHQPPAKVGNTIRISGEIRRSGSRLCMYPCILFSLMVFLANYSRARFANVRPTVVFVIASSMHILKHLRKPHQQGIRMRSVHYTITDTPLPCSTDLTIHLPINPAGPRHH